MRTRTKVNLDPVYEETIVDYDNPNMDDVSYGEYLKSSDSETMVDVVNSNYGLAARTNSLTSNPCSYTHTIIDNGSGTYRSAPDVLLPYTMTGDITGRTLTVSGWNSGLTPPTPPSNKDLLDIARAQAVANINPATFDFAEDFAEIGETIQFLRRPLRSVSDLLRDWRRSAGSASNLSARRTLERLSDAWLEYRFAISPLVRSAYDAYDAYHTNYAPAPRVATARGSENWSDERNYTGYGGTNIWLGTHSYHREVKASASIKYSISNPTEGLRAHLGIRNEDIPETLWAIFPLSFMVDRVSNISNLVRGVTNLLDPRLSILDASYVTRDLSREVLAITANTSGSGATVASPNYKTSETFQMNRVVWDVSFQDTFPSFQPEGLVSSAEEVLDLVSLIISRSRV